MGFWGAGVPQAKFNAAGRQLRSARLSHVFNNFDSGQGAPYRPINVVAKRYAPRADMGLQAVHISLKVL